MADRVDFSLTGLDSLMGKLESVKKGARKKAGRSALRKAANVVVKKARANAQRVDDPVTGRSIAKNVAARWNGRLFNRTGDLGFRVGVLHGAVLAKHPDKNANAPTPHWRLLEFGTEKMRAQPIMRPALAENIDEVTNTFINEFEKGLDKAIASAAGEGGST